jgi:hypothetical protein
MTDLFEHATAGLTSPLGYGFAITPDNDASLHHTTRELYVGTGGDIALVMKYGDSLLLKNVPSGARLPYRVNKVLEAGTTAEDIIGLY